MFMKRIAAIVLLTTIVVGYAAECSHAQGRGRGRGPQVPAATLLSSEMREHLKISDEQVEKIQQTLRDTMGALQGLGRPPEDATDEERAARDAKRTELMTKLEVSLKGVLDEKQFSRFQQIQMQRSGPRVLTNPELAAELKISEESRSKIEAIVKKAEEQRAANRTNAFSGEITRDVAETQREAIEKARDEAILATLTEEQRAAFTKRLGEPAPQFERGPSGRGPRGDGGPRPRGTDGGERTGQTPPQPKPTASTETNVPMPVVDGESVASFGEPSKEDGKLPEKLRFNFRLAQWADVLKMFADAAGLTLDLNAVPPGTFNYYDRNQYTPTEALDVINGHLIQKGFLLVRRNQFLVCLNVDDGIPPNLVPSVTVDELPKRGKNELMTLTIPLDGIEAEDAASEVEGLLGPQGKVVGLSKANQLVVTDIGSNLQRIYHLMTSVDATGDVVFEAFTLQHISVIDADDILRDLFGLPQRETGTTSTTSSRSNQPQPGAPQPYSRSRGFDPRSFYRGQQPQSNRSSSSSRTTSSGTTQIAFDLRTNSLLITAPPEKMKLISKAIERIDVETSSDVSEALPVMAATVAVLPLYRMDALTASTTLQSLFANDGNNGPSIQSHPTGGSLIVRGTTDQITEIKTLLVQMDPPTQTGGGRVRSIPLGTTDARVLLRMLEQAWGGDSAPNPIRIVVPSAEGPVGDERIPESGSIRTPATNRETPSRINDTRFDGKRGQDSRTPSNSSARNYPANERESALTRFATFFQDGKQTQNTGDPAKGRPDDGPKFLPPKPVESKAQEKPAATQDEKNQSTEGGQSQDSAEDAEELLKTFDELTGKEKPAKPKVPITVVPNGNNLVIVSSDEEALNELEDVINEIMQAMPQKSQWTVFYLRSADAIEAADMLEKLFPSSSVSKPSSATRGGGGLLGSLTGGLSSFGNTLMDATGLAGLGAGPLTLQIIPEPRSNALYVSGPINDVREVEAMLKVLDASELPDQLRTRAPRAIQLQYASVDEAAAIIRDVYKEEMTAQQRQGGGSGGGMAALFGGGNRGGNNRAQPVRLTIGVDKGTNRLIVSASDSLYRQVEAMVQEIEDAAREANRTVRVVNIGNVDSVLVQDALTSLLPKVNVTKNSSSQSSNRSSSSQPQQQNSGSSNEQREQFRRMFEQGIRDRIMQRMQGGGGGRPGFGSGGRPGGGGSPFSRGR